MKTTAPPPKATPPRHRRWYSLLWLIAMLSLVLWACPSTTPPEGAPTEGTTDASEATADGAGDVAPEAGPQTGTFTALTYNVHGLPPGITKDDSPGRMETIGPLLKPFTILGLQEVFIDDGYEKLKAPLDFDTHARYTDKKEGRFYGPGLLALARFALVEEQKFLYKDCFGTVNNAADCLASKGLQMVRLQLAPGVTLDVYNSHFEAGGDAEDQAARASNVKEVQDAMEKWSKGRALIFLGDTNLKEERASDKQALQSWFKAAQLTDSCEAVDCPEKGRIDRVLYRSSDALTLTATSWKIPEEFKDKEGTPLSDHDPIAVTFTWESKP